jgi:hypothetical protein
MLQNTFIHIQSIGAITEQRLWESGLRDWDAFTDDISIPLSGKRKYLLQKGIEETTPPVNPLSADLATIARIKSNSQYGASRQWY